MGTVLQMWSGSGVAMNQKLKNGLEKLAAAVGYDKQHLTRTVAYREIDRWLDALGTERRDALEISAGWKWRGRQWGSFTEMNWPQHDICKDVLDRKFDIVIADNVWEHLLYPYRAARNVHSMLRPGGWFVNITPFMIRYHPIPTDCSRWTELGMTHFLEEAGFDPARIVTGSWGNASAVKANFHRWARTGWKRSLPNDERFPVTIWAMAQKQRI
jgi:SAM-dependent methyltransferase